ncbi:MAG: DNA double-strand break repair nuclease NurA [Candidatus Korarchaeota archaeon]|nr:DNA double-strand break repair nuclease NurA [Candidatus Korarchaeota archaeon]
MSDEELSDWQKLPSPLQHQFYQEAENEATRQLRKYQVLRKKLDGLKEELSPFKNVPPADWKDLRVGVVDGSYSSTSERLGGKYALFSVGYKIFDGTELVTEEFSSGMVTMGHDRRGPRWHVPLKLIMTKLEREHGLDCLKEDVDWLLLDGSFFGFRAECAVVATGTPIFWYETTANDTVEQKQQCFGDLLTDVSQNTLALLREKNVIGIVKRARNSAIDGYRLYQRKDFVEDASTPAECLGRVEDVLFNLMDKAIFSVVLPPQRYFLYPDLFQQRDPGTFYHYSRLRGIYTSAVRWENKVVSLDKELAHCENLMKKEVRKTIGAKYYKVLMDGLLRGYFKAHPEASACCFEAHTDAAIREILPYLVGFNNPTTGYPFPLDLIDHDVALPKNFINEFMDEVEATMLKKSSDLSDLTKKLFDHLNPQKKWRT